MTETTNKKQFFCKYCKTELFENNICYFCWEKLPEGEEKKRYRGF